MSSKSITLGATTPVLLRASREAGQGARRCPTACSPIAAIPARTLFLGRPAHKTISVAKKTGSSWDARSRRQRNVAVCASTETDTIQEVDKSNWDAAIAESSDKLVIVDCYSQRCGPCKLIYPKLVEMAEKYSDGAKFVKLDCNLDNKELAQGLGVRTVPIFFFYKGNEQVGSVKGAKVDEIEEMIQKHL